MEILNSPKSSREAGGKLDLGAADCAEEVVNEVEMESVADSQRSRTPSPTPARWGSRMPVPPGGRTTLTLVPVTPTKGSKRMAMGTLRPKSHLCLVFVCAAPIGLAAASALEQIIAAIARGEKKMEEKVAALEVQMMEGMGALAADENEREVRMAARLLARGGKEEEAGSEAPSHRRHRDGDAGKGDLGSQAVDGSGGADGEKEGGIRRGEEGSGGTQPAASSSAYAAAERCACYR